MSFKLIDRPSLGAINWNTDRLKRLKDAADEARQNRDVKFVVDLGKPYRRVEFNTAYAMGVCDEVGAILAANPMPQFGENREGKEP